MDETDRQRLYREEADTLGQIGAALARVELPMVTVRIPAALARAAVKAWERFDDAPPDVESYEQRTSRHRAGALALIGLSISRTGREDGDDTIVDLSPEVIGAAISASDDLSG